MSPRAGSRLVTLGFTAVHDYVLGKADWLAHGLPSEGVLADAATAGTAMRSDVATARLDERVGDVRRRVEATRHRFGLVLADDGTLLGRLRRAALEGDPSATAEAVMEAGPATIRPNQPLEEVAEGLRRHGNTTRLVADPSGRLLGVVHRDDVLDDATP
jgi:CBS domain-containing protein